MISRSTQDDRILLATFFMFPFVDMAAALIDYTLFIKFHITALSALVVAIVIVLTGFRCGFSIARLQSLSKLSLALWGIVGIATAASYTLSGGDGYRTVVTFALVLVGPVLVYTLKHGSNGLGERLLSTLISSFAVYCALFLALHLTGLYQPPLAGKTFATFPGFGNIRHIGYMLAPIIIVGVFLWAQGQTGPKWLPFPARVICLSLLWAVLMFSGSRAGFLSAIVGMMFALAFANGHRLAPLKLFIITFSIGFLIAAVLPDAGPKMGVWDMFMRSSEASSVNDLSANRTALWKMGFTEALNKPLIGHGIGQFSTVTQTLGRPVVQAHNAVIEYLYAIGFIGTFSLIAWVFLAWVSMIKNCLKGAATVSVAAFSGVTVLLVFSMLDGVFFNYNPILLSVVLFSTALSTFENSASR
jgi:O-antigen ligase